MHESLERSMFIDTSFLIAFLIPIYTNQNASTSLYLCLAVRPMNISWPKIVNDHAETENTLVNLPLNKITYSY